MFGGQHRIDAAERARASWGGTSETKQPQRRDSRAVGKVCSCAEKIRIKSLETVGVVRDNALTGEVKPNQNHRAVMPLTKHKTTSVVVQVTYFTDRVRAACLKPSASAAR